MENVDINKENNNVDKKVMNKKKSRKRTTLRFKNVKDEEELNGITNIMDLLLQENASLNIRVRIEKNPDTKNNNRNKEILEKMNELIQKCMN